MTALQTEVAEVAERTGFSGAVRVDREGDTVVCAAYGLADRAHGIPATVDTQFAMASGTKSLTAVTVMALVEQGTPGSTPPPGRCWARTCRWSATVSRSSICSRTARASVTTWTRAPAATSATTR